MIHYVKNLKEKIRDYLNRSKETFNKILHPFIIKLTKLRIEENFWTWQIYLPVINSKHSHMEKFQKHFFWTQEKDKMPTITTSFQTKEPSLWNSLQKKKKRYKICKGRNASVIFLQTIIVYIDNSKKFTDKLLWVLNSFNNIVGHKVNIKKWLLFLLINRDQLANVIGKTKISFIMAQ